MNGYDFIASLFQSLVSLAWPVTVLIIVYLFRTKLSDLLPLLRLKHNDTEISFSLEKAADLAENLPPPPGEVADPVVQPSDEAVRLAELSPRASVIDSFMAVEAEIRKLSAERGIELARRTSRDLAELLRASGEIDPISYSLFQDLRVMRNRAVHETQSFEISVEDALRYQALAARLVSSLQAHG